jgi:hypothetical protein
VIQAPADERFQLRIHFLRDERRLCAAVLDVVRELCRHTHWIDRHDDRVRTQNGVVRNDELRAVLHDEQHAIAFSDRTVLLQKSGQTFHFVLEIGERQRRLEEDNEWLVGVTSGGDLSVVEQIGRRRSNIVW